ncbi:M16 family metallopeptidase [Algoriphagus sp.]|uniref:M16 family metallopeptidase n=1 Tax=Algoriphagus sp. TaxID=1872435 RepID=UPI003F6FAB43
MLSYTRFFLDNGLEVIVHEDHSSKTAVFNLLYKVGSRNEIPGKTGLAHFFEHLMFGGSANVPVFDRELERVGGSCNAFTSQDITNYYITLPGANLETAFWLESDRMFQLSLSTKTIETQRKVVIEEYKQRYLNQPYGDAYHHLDGLAYDIHPYRWPTIGQSLDDILNYTQEDTWAFYKSNYRPDNAVLVVAGAVKQAEVERMAKKWFEPIQNHPKPDLLIPTEPVQKTKKTKLVEAPVPTDALYKAYKMPAKLAEGYWEADLITDILGFGKSSILEQTLVKNGKLFASISAYITGSLDPGLLTFAGKMESGVAAEEAEKALDEVISGFLKSQISDYTLQKIQNQEEAHKTYESVEILNRAMNLAGYAHLGNPALYDEVFDIKSKIKGDEIMHWANSIIKEENSSVLYYKSAQE